MLKALMQLLGIGAAQAPTAYGPETLATPAPSVPHWPSSGQFRLLAVGENFYAEALQATARNPDGYPALTFCTAELVPEVNNPYDPNAVAVIVSGRKVAHLSRQDALALRQALSRAGIPASVTTCSAVITGGLFSDGKRYSYSVELDLDITSTSPTANRPAYTRPVQHDPAPTISRDADQVMVTCFAPHSALEDLDRGETRVNRWTAEHWTTVNYYVANQRNAGLGTKLFSIDKEVHRQLFDGEDVDVELLGLEGRTLRVRMSKADPTAKTKPTKRRTLKSAS